MDLKKKKTFNVESRTCTTSAPKDPLALNVFSLLRAGRKRKDKRKESEHHKQSFWSDGHLSFLMSVCLLYKQH